MEVEKHRSLSFNEENVELKNSILNIEVLIDNAVRDGDERHRKKIISEQQEIIEAAQLVIATANTKFANCESTVKKLKRRLLEVTKRQSFIKNRIEIERIVKLHRKLENENTISDDVVVTE